MQIISMVAILECYENHINSPWRYFETFVKYIMTAYFHECMFLIELNYSSYAIIIHTFV